MKTRNETITEQRQVVFYIADDGTEFTNQSDCEEYSKKLQIDIERENGNIKFLNEDLTPILESATELKTLPLGAYVYLKSDSMLTLFKESHLLSHKSYWYENNSEYDSDFVFHSILNYHWDYEWELVYSKRAYESKMQKLQAAKKCYEKIIKG